LINLLEREAYLKILLLMKELDKSLLKQKMPLGILIDKEQDIDQVFIPIFKSDDSFLIDYAQN
jgi:hypothetical protein